MREINILRNGGISLPVYSMDVFYIYDLPIGLEIVLFRSIPPNFPRCRNGMMSVLEPVPFQTRTENFLLFPVTGYSKRRSGNLLLTSKFYQ